jgi:hypothetical protein
MREFDNELCRASTKEVAKAKDRVVKLLDHAAMQADSTLLVAILHLFVNSNALQTVKDNGDIEEREKKIVLTGK